MHRRQSSSTRGGGGDYETIQNAVENWNRGIHADGNDDSWTASNNGQAVDASQSYGSWSANENIIRNNDSQNDVKGANPNTSDATQNYWDQPEGPVEGQCIDADCSDPLEPPQPMLGGSSFKMSHLTPTTATIAQGGSLNVSASVESIAEVQQSATAQLSLGGVTQTGTVSLEAGQSKRVRFDGVDLSGLFTGEYQVTVSADGARAGGTV